MLRLASSSLRGLTKTTTTTTTTKTRQMLFSNARGTTAKRPVSTSSRRVRMSWRMDDDVGGDDSPSRRQHHQRTSSGGNASSSSSSFSRGLNGGENRRDDDDYDDYRSRRRGQGRRGGRGRKNSSNYSGGGRGGRGGERGRAPQTSSRNNYYDNNNNNSNNNNNNNYYYDENDEYDNYNSRDRRGGGGGGDSRGYHYNNKPVYLQRKEERKATREQPTLREMALGEVIFGQNPVKEAMLQNKRDEFYRLWIQEGDGGSYSSDEKMIARAKELGCTISYATKHDLNMLTESRPHQGVALDCTPLEMDSIESLLEENGSGDDAETRRDRQHPLWLALDEIIDPQNFGAILRTAHFLNINGVVVCAKNSAPLSPVVSKASSGAMESIKVYQTNAMHKFLAKCVDDGFNVVGLANQSGAENVSDLSLNQPTVLVVGNEGSGLRTNVRRACSRIAKIEGGSDKNGAGANKTTSVESLNVSVATAIALFQLTNTNAVKT